MKNNTTKKESSQKPMSKQDLETVESVTDKSVTVALNTDAEEYYIFYKGQKDLTFKETLTMWMHLSDWVVSRAREIDQQVPTKEGEISCGTHAIRTFAQRVVKLGQEEKEISEGLQLNNKE